MTELSEVCDCQWKEPNAALQDENEYEDCVNKAIEGPVCEKAIVLEEAKCLPFSTTESVSSPTSTPSLRATPTSAPTESQESKSCELSVFHWCCDNNFSLCCYCN